MIFFAQQKFQHCGYHIDQFWVASLVCRKKIYVASKILMPGFWSLSNLDRIKKFSRDWSF
jgi:hypothetical protein